MSSSDDEDESWPTEVSDYYFVDKNNAPISFAELPLKLDDANSSDKVEKEIGLRGSIDNGLQQFFAQVTAWKFDISSSPSKPEIYVVSLKNNWIKLLKPKKSYEAMIRTILITVHCLNYVKRNPGTSAKALWEFLAKVFSLYEPRPSERDLVGHQDLISEVIERDEELKRSKVLVTFLKDKPNGKKASGKEFGNTTMSSFIVDDEKDQIDEDGSDSDSVEEDETDEDGSDDEDADIFEAVCAICDNGGVILCCEGKCLRSFHATKEAGVESSCDSLGYSEEQFKAIENQTFVCKNCQFNLHQCFICGKLGSSDKSADAEVFQCVAGTCGYFYHPNCVAKALRFKFGDKAKDLEGEITAGKPFMCPIHFCAVCRGLEPQDKTDEQMQFAVCRRCPKAYHRKCLPRAISFEDDEEKDIVQRAWSGLMPNKILIYCLKHEIDEELGTPIRNHINFPDNDKKKGKQTSKFVSKEEVETKKRVILSKDGTGGKSASKQSKASEKSSSAMKKVDSNKTNEGQSTTRYVPKKQKLADESKMALKKTLPGKDNEPTDVGSPSSLGAQLFALLIKDSDAVKTVSGGAADTKEPKRKCSSTVKDLNDSVVLDHDSEKRILSILKEAESSITLEDIMRRHKTPSTYVTVPKRMSQHMQNMTLGRIEASTEAISAAVQKLHGGGSLEDAKVVCEPGLLNQITKFKNKLKVYLSPFLHGPRYTSYGRHFTKVDKLQAIVDKLHWYVGDGDMMVDFCCGANDFSWLMKQKMDELGKRCNFRNYDIFPAKNNFNFVQKDWMKVQTSELPPGSQLIMGLNPPFGTSAILAKKFIDKALEFKPKLLILIVPRETERFDDKNPYDLIWEDDKLLGGKAFYLPGSIDINEKQMDDWNVNPPPLYLWSHRDWTTKHKEIALQQGHLPGVQKIEECPLQELFNHLEDPLEFNNCSGLQDAKQLEMEVEKIIESHVAGSCPDREDQKSHEDNAHKGQVSGECGKENNKKRKGGSVSDEQSPVKQSVPPMRPSPIAGGRPWDLGERKGHQNVEHANVTSMQLHMDRNRLSLYGSYPDDRMAMRGMDSDDHYLSGRNRWAQPVDPGSDSRSRVAAEDFNYPRDFMNQAYAREADMRAQIQMYGNPNSGFVTHPGNHLAAPASRFPSTYMQLGATLESAYSNGSTSAMERYNLRLDESSNGLRRMASMGPMQRLGLDGGRGMSFTPPPPHHGPGGYLPPHGHYPPF